MISDLKENSCDDKETSIDRAHKQSENNNLTESANAMADCEEKSHVEEGEDINGNLEENKPVSKSEPDDENIVGDDSEMEPGEISFNQANSMDLQAAVQAQTAASAVLNEANAIFNNNAAMFPPGQMTMQTFQNAIAQFTANAIANNMDNETVMKNLAILQSALFTLQQQQFLQFQLIQHLQSQLVNKKGDTEGPQNLTNKSESDDDEQDSKIMKDDIDEEDGEMEDIEEEVQSQMHKRLMDNKHFSKMHETLLKEENERR